MIAPLQPLFEWDDEPQTSRSSSSLLASHSKSHRPQRLVTPHPLFPESSSIETVWDDDKITVWSGPDSLPRILHASLTVTCETVVWTSFADFPKHRVLCALLHSTQVCLWDIYPQQQQQMSSDDPNYSNDLFSLPAEGWTVSLPFECSGILAVEQKGLLLQRLDYAEDEEEEDDFILKSPPTRRTFSSSIPSLFSLTHPLQDVVPVCQLLNNNLSQNQPPVTDVHEKWIWMGQIEAYSLSLVVSYHTVQQKHRVWAVRDAPPPPREATLYEQTRWNPEHNLMVLDMDLVGPPQSTPFASRQEALADAMGLRRTPRKADSSTTRMSLEAPMAPLHAQLALELLFTSPVQPEAESLFLVSNIEGSANSVLCLFGPDNRTLGSKALHFWSIEGTGIDDAWQISPHSGLPCTAAHPVSTSGSSSTRDVVVQPEDVPDHLYLLRAWCPLVECSLHETTKLSLEDARHDRVTVAVPSGRKVVCQLPGFTLDSLTNRVLDALEASLQWTAGQAETSKRDAYHILALKLRTDVSSLCYTHASKPFTAVQQVLMAIAQLEWEGLAQPEPMSSTLTSWEQLLLTSDLDSNLGAHEAPSFFGNRETALDFSTTETLSTMEFIKREEIANLLPSFFDHLHLLYEDLKLSEYQSQDRFQLGLFLIELCRSFPYAEDKNATRFLEYYEVDADKETRREVASSKGLGTRSQVLFSRLAMKRAIPSLFAWFESVVGGMIPSKKTFGFEEYPDFSPFRKTNSLQKILQRVFTENTADRNWELVTTLLSEGFTDVEELKDGFPAAIAFPILEILKSCRITEELSMDAMQNWSRESWALVGRQDLSMNMASNHVVENLRPSRNYKHNGRSVVIDESKFADVDNDGLVPLQLTSALLFPDDNRIHEAARLLRSSRPLLLRVERAVEVTDHDYERLKQKRLLSLSYRSLSLPIGRGMMTIGNLRPIPAEPLPVPVMSLKGRVPPANLGVTLDATECPSDFRVWPEFHNGVAAALRLPIKNESSGFFISRTWIVYNKPPPFQEQLPDGSEPDTEILYKNHSHGGVLFGLGLRGHLTALEMSDLYEYLTRGTVTTTVGILLGLAANKRGTCDMAVSKMLCLHIPALIPQHFSSIDVAGAVQSAAVLGAGLLFQRSSHRMMTEFLLNEIGKRPDSDASAFDRESYNLACGIALGTVNLCLIDRSQGIDRAAGLADLNIEERLHKYIAGGIDKDERERTRESNDRFSIPTAAPTGDNEKCSTIYEGDLINTEVTAPGATLALGLMYMKSGNKTISSILALPDTHFILEFVRPDLLTLRLISRSLIMWDEVRPSTEWIKEQVPSAVIKSYSQMRAMAKRALEGFAPLRTEKADFDFDRRAVRQIYVHTIAGACFGMGLRFAGTGNMDAMKAIESFVLEFYSLRESNDPVAATSKPELPILETALGCTAISLAMVMAGTGDLRCLRVLKMLSWRCDETPRHGFHMTCGMAIGLLFLGGGTCTLGREPEDIAVLLTSFFPRFPSSTSDNQCHLQPLRHLYALAVKQSELRAVDVETGEEVSVKVEIWSDGLKDPERLTMPALLRNADKKRQEVRLLSKDYFPVKLKFEDLLSHRTLFVKRKRTPSDWLLSSSEKRASTASEGRERVNVSLDRILLASNGKPDTVLITLLEEFSFNQSDTLLSSILSLCRGDKNTDSVWYLGILKCYIENRTRWGIQGADQDDLLLSYLLETMERCLTGSAACSAYKRITIS